MSNMPPYTEDFFLRTFLNSFRNQTVFLRDGLDDIHVADKEQCCAITISMKDKPVTPEMMQRYLLILEKCPPPVCLIFNWVNYGGEFDNFIMTHKTLRHVAFYKCGFYNTTVFSTLAAAHHVDSVSVAYELRTEGAGSITPALERLIACKRCMIIDTRSIYMTDRALAALFAAVGKSRTLQALEMQFWINSTDILVEFNKMLTTNQSLRALNFNFNTPRSNDIYNTIFSALGSRKGFLTELQLPWTNDLRERYVRLLKTNYSIRRVEPDATDHRCNATAETQKQYTVNEHLARNRRLHQLTCALDKMQRRWTVLALQKSEVFVPLDIVDQYRDFLSTIVADPITAPPSKRLLNACETRKGQLRQD